MHNTETETKQLGLLGETQNIKGTTSQKGAGQGWSREDREKNTKYTNDLQKGPLHPPPSNGTTQSGWLHAYVAFQP